MEDQINFKELYIHFLLKQENVIFVLMDFQGEGKNNNGGTLLCRSIYNYRYHMAVRY